MSIMKSIKILIIFPFFILIQACDKEVFTGIVESTKVENGKIFVTSNPSGANIYLSGHNMGQITPDTLIWLKSGVHNLKLRVGLYKDTLINVNAVDGQINSVFIDFTKNPGQLGKIVCNSLPNYAKIYLNDIDINRKTPYTITGLLPGYYEVKFSFPQYRSDSATVALHGGEASEVTVTLEDTSKWVNYTVHNSPMTNNFVYDVTVDQQDVKWFGTADGLVRFDNKKWKIYNQDNSQLKTNIINTLGVDLQNKLWIGTTNGLYLLTGNELTDLSSHIPDPNVTSFAFDMLGNVWIGTQSGLVKFDGVNWQIFRTNNSGITENFVTALSISNDGKIWIGQFSSGITVFDGSKWTRWNMSNMQLGEKIGDIIKTIAVDKDGVILVGHLPHDKLGYLGGITKFDGVKWSIVELTGIPNDKIESIDVDQNNFKWFSSRDGLAKYKAGNTLLIFNSNNAGLIYNHITSVKIDKSGDLWIATFGGGVQKLKKGNY